MIVIPGWIRIENACDALWAGLLVSLTPRVKLNVPGAFGVPEIIPLGAMLKPPGSEPAVTDQV